MTFLTEHIWAVTALQDSGWDKFYRDWVEPIFHVLIPIIIALLALVVISGLITRFMVRRDTTAWEQKVRWLWAVVGTLSMAATAVFLPVFPAFHPFGDGVWLPWTFGGIAALGVALTVFSLRLKVSCPVHFDRKPGGLAWPVFSLLLAAWAVLVFYFISGNERISVAYAALALLGVTATATALGQSRRLQIEAQGPDGKSDPAASDYVLARLQSLGSRAPELGILQVSELSKLLSKDLSAIPSGALATAIAHVMYAVRPDLTWRARITLIDVNRVVVSLTRNGLHVKSELISRVNLGLPELPPEAKPPRLEEELGRARAQLLTGAAAFILIELSQRHRDLLKGLCGAQHWKPVALHMIASERALVSDKEVRVRLLQSAVNMDPRYGLARLDYLTEVQNCMPNSVANRMRMAHLMDRQLELVREQEDRSGWEGLCIRILYSCAAIRTNAYLAARAISDDHIDQLGHEHPGILDTAHEAASDLLEECETVISNKEFLKKDPAAYNFACYMKPVAENLKSAISFLADESRLRINGGTWTWAPPEPDRHPPPKLAHHYACLAALAEERGVPRQGLDDTLDYLTFALTTPSDRQSAQSDPSFWSYLQDPIRAAQAEHTVRLKPLAMLDLEPFKRFAKPLTEAGITTFRNFQLRASGVTQRQKMADYLNVSTLVVSHLKAIASLAALHHDLARPDVVRVFLEADITTPEQLRSRAAEDRQLLISELRAKAENCGVAHLAAFITPDVWLDAI
ncbi:hypothetical protein [Streptomyces roseoverticillatus]|uniref:hypothetical protein n=1 Tax=Streptomyces roseoverticillatus TaxID=66429 RepID=UPI000A613E32|nr:hypothetical protein [Streptomyces roseoverticillatus]